MCSFAYDIEIDGIYYNLHKDTKTAEVTFGENYYRGDVNIPSSVTYGGIILPVTSIGDKAFDGCTFLTSVTIPSSVTNIGYKAFCAAGFQFTSVVIPNSVVNIGKKAFSLNLKLSSVTIGTNVKKIGDGAFSSCNSLTSVTIPNSVTSIGDEAFWDCKSLTHVIIGDSVISIGQRAFEYCESLTSVTLGASVASVGSSAFYDCKSLLEVYSLNQTPPNITEYTFNGLSKVQFTVYVPAESVEKYKVAEYWKDFWNISSVKENNDSDNIPEM